MQKPLEHPSKDLTFWENFGRGTGEGRMYQMGDNVVRSFILEKMVSLGVKTLLDVGCGSGPIYEIIKQKELPIEYTGADYAESFIENNTTQFPEGKWFHDDARHSRFADGAFDCVLFLHSLDSIRDWDAAVREASRITKKYVVIVLWRPFQTNGQHNLHSDEQWADTHLCEFAPEILESEFARGSLKIDFAAEMMNGHQYNFIYVLEKV